MRGRRANKPVVVQRGRSGAGQRHGDGGRRGNDVESEAVVPLESNQDSPVCVLPTWMSICLCGCMHVFCAFYDCMLCVFAWAPMCLCSIQFMCVCVCVQTQLALQLITLQPTADYTALVLSSIYSVLRLLSAWEPARN